MQKKLPKPFSRPSVDLERHGKVWKTIPAHKIKIGFNVADFGVVADMSIGNYGIELVNGENIHYVLDTDDEVFAFGNHG